MNQYQLLVESEDRVVRFRLLGDDDVYLAARQVSLDDHSRADWESVFDFRAYVDRYAGNLVRGERTATADDLVADAGLFIGEQLLGEEIVAKLQGTQRRTLVVQLPDPHSSSLAASFARVPWELARTAAHPKPLFAQAVVIRQQLQNLPPLAQPDATPNVRVLLVFAEAPGSRPLAMRYEREQLLDLFFSDVLSKRNVQIDVLCHGVTRERLEEQIRSRGGYHIIHWSGHGHHNLLEMHPDPITSQELVDLFIDAGGFIPQLMFLSACQSASVVRISDWSAFHAAMTDAKPADAPSQPGYTGTALELLRAGVPQVVAMRNEVTDDYARELALRFYQRLLADPAKNSCDSALALARGELVRDKDLASSFNPVDHVTPVLLGHVLPPLEPERERSAQHGSRWPAPQPLLTGGRRELDRPDVFVGRSAELTQLATEWLPDTGPAVALVQGLAGLGKTALAAEAIQLWHTRFDMVLAFQAKPSALTIEDFYRDLDLKLTLESSAYRERCDRSPYSRVYLVPGQPLSGAQRLERLRNNVVDVLRNERILLVIDNYESNLETVSGPDGYRSQDPQWGVLLGELAARLPQTDSRLLVTTRHRPAALADAKATIWLPLGPLPMMEASLYLRSHDSLRALYFGDASGRALVMRLLSVSRGHPLILDRLASLADDRDALPRALDHLERHGGWKALPDLFAGAKSAAEREKERAYLEDVTVGAIDLLIERATAEARLLLWIITLASEPVTTDLLESVWSRTTFEDNSLRKTALTIAQLDLLPEPEQKRWRAALDTDEGRAVLERIRLLPELVTPPLMPLLVELTNAGLVSITRSATGDSATYSFHELVRERAGTWFSSHPEERASWTEQDVWASYGRWYRDLSQMLQSLPEAPRQVTTRTGRTAIGYFVRADNLEDVGNFAQSVIVGTRDPAILRTIADDLRTAAEKVPAGKMRLRFRSILADALNNAGRPDEALPFFEAAAEEAITANSPDLAPIYHNWAIALSRLEKLNSAKEKYLLAAEIHRKAGSPEIMAITSELEALRIDVTQGRARHALPEINSRVAKIREWHAHESAGKQVPQAPLHVGFMLRALISGLDVALKANAGLGHWKIVLDLGTELETLARAFGRSELELAIIRFNLYDALTRLGRLDEARRIVEECLTVFKREDNIRLQAMALGALGAIRDDGGDHERGVELTRQALSLHNRLPSPRERSTGHLNLAVILDSVGDHNEAAWHRLAGGIYRIVSGQEEAWLHRHLLPTRRDANSQAVGDPLPRVRDLVSNPQFSALAEFLEESSEDLSALQTRIDTLSERADQLIAESEHEPATPTTPPPPPAPSSASLESHVRRSLETRSAEPSDPIAAQDGPRQYTVWFGTNRKPIDPAKPEMGFTGQRDVAKVHYGACRVAIPQSHKFGSLGSRWWKRVLTLSDDRVRLREIRPAAEDDFWQLIRAEIEAWGDDEPQALVYLHGYNVTFAEAAIRAAQIGFDLKVPGVTAFFSWPSQGSLEDYAKDGATIESSEAAITAFLVGFTQRFGEYRVHVIAHSMGNRALLRAMHRINANAEQRGRIKFGQVFLAAPDVDADLFRDLAPLYADLSRRTTMYASPSDRAVALSRWFHGAPRAGFTPPITVVRGIDTIEIPDFDLDMLGHSYYAEAAGVLHDMFDLLRHDSAPGARQRLHAASAECGAYWTMLG